LALHPTTAVQHGFEVSLKEPYSVAPVVAVHVAEDVLEKRFASKDTGESAPPLALEKPGHRERDCTNGLVQYSSLQEWAGAEQFTATHRPLPQHYICNRCNIPGHWKKDCLHYAEGGAGGGVNRDGVKMRDGQFQKIEHVHVHQKQALPWLPSAHAPPVANLVVV